MTQIAARVRRLTGVMLLVVVTPGCSACRHQGHANDAPSTIERPTRRRSTSSATDRIRTTRLRALRGLPGHDGIRRRLNLAALRTVRADLLVVLILTPTTAGSLS